MFSNVDAGGQKYTIISIIKEEFLEHFMWLRKAHYNLMCRALKAFEANILAGRAKTVDAKHYAMYELDMMTMSYTEAWKKFGITIS